eukprot:8272235-Lingulodinium_polyedra.AAC.1
MVQQFHYLDRLSNACTCSNYGNRQTDNIVPNTATRCHRRFSPHQFSEMQRHLVPTTASWAKGLAVPGTPWHCGHSHATLS